MQEPAKQRICQAPLFGSASLAALQEGDQMLRGAHEEACISL